MNTLSQLFLILSLTAPAWSYIGSPTVQGCHGWLSASPFGERSRCCRDRLRGGGRGGAVGMSMFDRSGNANRKQKTIIWISTSVPCVIQALLCCRLDLPIAYEAMSVFSRVPAAVGMQGGWACRGGMVLALFVLQTTATDHSRVSPVADCSDSRSSCDRARSNRDECLPHEQRVWDRGLH